MNIKKRISRLFGELHIEYFIFVILSLTPFLLVPDYNSYQMIGQADFISPINSSANIFKYLFTYRFNSNDGITNLYLLPSLFPFYFFSYLFNIVNFSPVMSTLIYISFILLTAQISMYTFLTYIQKQKLNNKKGHKPIIFCFAILYAFSPFVTHHIDPGHFVMNFFYSFFPSLLLQFDILMNRNKISFKTISLIFFISIFLSASFGNIANFYIFLAVFFVYGLINTIIENSSFICFCKKYIIFIITLIIAIFWWFLPYIIDFLFNINSIISVNNQNPLNDSVGVATQHTSVVSFFLNPEIIFYYTKHLLVGGFLFYIYSFLTILFLISILFGKKKWSLIALTFIILGIFITKGLNPPFQTFFIFLYDNLPGFKIFRRPVSKFYWVFLFFFLSLAFSGAIKIADKMKMKFIIIYIFLLFSSLYFVYDFVKRPITIRFNIPKYYYECRDYLLQNKVNKILALENYGAVSYGSLLNGYNGSLDFLEDLWPFSISKPNIFNTNQIPTNTILKKIYDNKSFCTDTKQTSISHIIIRSDVLRDNKSIYNEKILLNNLNKSKEVEKPILFGNYKNGIVVYKIKNKCTNKIVNTSKNKMLAFQIVNPTKIKIHIKNINNLSHLFFFNNFSNNWGLFLAKSSENFLDKNEEMNNAIGFKNKIFFEGEELSYLFKKSLAAETHRQIYGYANEWTINTNKIKSEYTSEFWENNPDGTINLNVILYYKPQSYLYLGLATFFISIIAAVVCFIHSFLKYKNEDKT